MWLQQLIVLKCINHSLTHIANIKFQIRIYSLNVYKDQVCYQVCLNFLIGQVMGVVVLILIINNGGISGYNCGLSLIRLFVSRNRLTQ